MKRTVLFIALLGCMPPASRTEAQPAAAPAVSIISSPLAYATPDDQDDPGQSLYKEGYSLILEEQWNPARKKFAELLGNYPSTRYGDDARYWSAYALMHTDLRKALSAYQTFVKKHSKSTYYTDAVADLANIQARLAAEQQARMAMKLQMAQIDTLRFRIPSPAVAPRATDEGFTLEPGVTAEPRVTVQPGVTPEPGVMPDVHEFKMNMRHLGWALRSIQHRFGTRPSGSPWWWQPGAAREDDDSLDEPTRLKLQALSAIGNGKQDERGYETLKEVALDKRQSVVLRNEALGQLSEFTKYDPASVFLDVAKNDTTEELQNAAIDYLRHSAQDKNTSVGNLITLFGALPASRSEQRAMIVYEIADVGNDRAVEFLLRVAKSDADYSLRSDAVYYLGNIGGDKARTALYEILKSK